MKKPEKSIKKRNAAQKRGKKRSDRIRETKSKKAQRSKENYKKRELIRKKWFEEQKKLQEYLNSNPQSE